MTMTTVISGKNQGAYFGHVGSPHVYVDSTAKCLVMGIAGRFGSSPAILFRADGTIELQTVDGKTPTIKKLDPKDVEDRLTAFIKSFQ